MQTFLQALFIAAGVVVLLFGFVVMFGAPYLPTLKKQTAEALDLLKLKPGQTMLELGSGDGRVARAAAQRGIKVIGYELNPLLVLIAKLNTLKYRRQVSIRWANYWSVEWPETDAIFVFLLAKYMKKLDKKIVQQRARQKHPIKLLSYTFTIPGKLPTKHQGGLYLYQYK